MNSPSDHSSSDNQTLNLRQILPFSTGTTAIGRGEIAQITSRPQVAVCWPTRLVIKHPERWTIDKVTVDRGDKLALIANDVPGLKCTASGSESPLRFEQPVNGYDDLAIVVSHVGDKQEVEPFEACFFTSDRPIGPICQPQRVGNNRQASIQLSSAHPVAPNKSMAIDLPDPAPDATGFFAEQLTLEGAHDWVVNDIIVRGKTIFVQSGDLPGVMFSGHPNALRLDLGYLAPSDSFRLIVTYIGAHDDGAICRCTLKGPRAAEDRAADRLPYLLPMSSGRPIGPHPHHSGQLTGRIQPDPDRIPDGYGFRVRRIVVDRPEAWVFNDFKIGNLPEFIQAGDVPGIAFSHDAVPDLIAAYPAYPKQDVVLVVTYLGDDKEGEPFVCGMAGDIVPIPAHRLR